MYYRVAVKIMFYRKYNINKKVYTFWSQLSRTVAIMLDHSKDIILPHNNKFKAYKKKRKETGELSKQLKNTKRLNENKTKKHLIYESMTDFR